MDFGALKKSVKAIEMSDEMQNRIITNCRLATVYEMEEITMKKRIKYKKTMVIAAVVALCLCVSVAAAAGPLGLFKDIRNWSGTVIGTTYEQATNEIEVGVAAARDKLTVTATLLSPDAVPYSEIETFGIGEYQIIDASGNVVAEGESANMVEIIDGTAEITVFPDGIDSGDYKLLVNCFTGAKKADQPIEICGSWECVFSVLY